MHTQGCARVHTRDRMQTHVYIYMHTWKPTYVLKSGLLKPGVKKINKPAHSSFIEVSG